MTDRENIEKLEWRSRGLTKGMVEEFFEAYETFRGFDLSACCRNFNGGLMKISEPETENND
jgi:hypothetical protein